MYIYINIYIYIYICIYSAWGLSLGSYLNAEECYLRISSSRPRLLSRSPSYKLSERCQLMALYYVPPNNGSRKPNQQNGLCHGQQFREREMGEDYLPPRSLEMSMRPIENSYRSCEIQNAIEGAVDKKLAKCRTSETVFQMGSQETPEMNPKIDTNGHQGVPVDLWIMKAATQGTKGASMSPRYRLRMPN